MTSICENLTGIVTLFQRVDDVYGAARYLATLPYVDTSRIGIMGFSNGAVTAFEAVQAHRVSALDAATPRFKISIPLYPECLGRQWSWVVPMLILNGDRDDWTLAKSCTDIRPPAGVPPFEVKVLRGALHAFDEPGSSERLLPTAMNINSPTRRGASVGGNPQATEQAKRDIAAFLDQHLRAAP